MYIKYTLYMSEYYKFTKYYDRNKRFFFFVISVVSIHSMLFVLY